MPLSEAKKAYRQRPEVKAARAAWLRAYRAATPAYRARKAAQDRLRKQTPEGANANKAGVQRWRLRHPARARDAAREYAARPEIKERRHVRDVYGPHADQLQELRELALLVRELRSHSG